VRHEQERVVVENRWKVAAAFAATVMCVGVTVGATASSAGAQAVNRAPVGRVDDMRSGPDGVLVSGWALDPDGPGPVTVAAFEMSGGHIDDATYQTAAESRPDVAAAYPGFGDQHGFDMLLTTGIGDHTVCVSAYDLSGVGAALPTTLGCRTVHVSGGDPFGNLELVAPAEPVGGTSVRIAGWAIDPDTADAIQVAITIDGKGGWVSAYRVRADVAAAYPGYSVGHGFDYILPTTAGAHQVCVSGINVGPGGNALIGCRNVTMPNDSPFGTIDAVLGAGAHAEVAGWAIDPGTAAPIQVAVYVGTAGAWHLADVSRPDVAAAFPTFGATHGFEVPVAVPPTGADVCVWGINTGPGDNVLLGCRPVPGSVPPG
jgi:hypothetical protein